MILIKNLRKIMKTWFFEFIEDAVGEKTLKKYKDEMNKKNKS